MSNLLMKSFALEPPRNMHIFSTLVQVFLSIGDPRCEQSVRKLCFSTNSGYHPPWWIALFDFFEIEKYVFHRLFMVSGSWLVLPSEAHSLQKRRSRDVAIAVPANSATLHQPRVGMGVCESHRFNEPELQHPKHARRQLPRSGQQVHIQNNVATKKWQQLQRWTRETKDVE